MNQFGATEGGPLYIPGLMHRTHKTFFFGGYEGLRLGAVSQMTSTVPDSAMVGGNLSEFLGAQLTGANATDALCRPVLAGQIYNPFTTRSVTATCATANNTVGQMVEIRDPVPNNNIAAVSGLEESGRRRKLRPTSRVQRIQIRSAWEVTSLPMPAFPPLPTR